MKTINEPDITQQMDQAIRDLLCRCFPEEVENFSQTRTWHGSGPEYSVVLSGVDGELQAHVGVVNRTVNVGGTALTVAGIQNVCVTPAQRGKGLSDQVMIESMHEAARRGFDAGLLFCLPVLEKVYARCGWISVGEREVVRTEAGVDIPIPDKNIAMYFPLRVTSLPEGTIHLQGNDW